MILKLTRRHDEWGVLCHINPDAMFTHLRTCTASSVSVDHQQWPSERLTLSQPADTCNSINDPVWKRGADASRSSITDGGGGRRSSWERQPSKPEIHTLKIPNRSVLTQAVWSVWPLGLAEWDSPAPQHHGFISKKRCWCSIASAHSPVNTFKPVKGPPSYSSMLPTDWEARSVRTFLKSPARAEITVGLFECSPKTRYDHYSIEKEININFIAKYCRY